MDKPDFGEFQLVSACVDGDGATPTTKWRRERDSNPRSPFRLSGFQDRLFQPLTHPSGWANPFAWFIVRWRSLHQPSSQLYVGCLLRFPRPALLPVASPTAACHSFAVSNIASGLPASVVLVQGDLKEIPLYRSADISIDGGIGAGSESRHPCRVNGRDNIQPLNILDGFQARRWKLREVLASS
jgi:hypothetical protein